MVDGDSTDNGGDAADRTLRDVPAGMAFGRYRVSRLHAEGSFGAVYIAHDPDLNREVAVKALTGGGPEDVEELLAEARRLARLRHAGVLTIHDVGVQDGQCYLVSDYLEGETLAQWLERPRGWAEVARVTALIADALAHAHGQRVVHRDVKPSNVIVMPDGQPVLCDFGLALSDQVDAAPDRRVLGSPVYMSPEQVEGRAHRIDGRTDIFSLGVLLYEALCGRRPFAAKARQELFRQIREDDPQPPRQIVAEIPRELERICLKALAKKLADRYTTAADMASELRAVVRKEAGAPGAALGATSGVPVPTPRGPGETQRRHVTVLSCGIEVAGDPEEQHATLEAFRARCTEVARRFGGAVVPSTEPGLLVCFGYPIAFEDAAFRAVCTALDIVDGSFDREHPPSLCVHSALALVGEDAARNLTMVGEARSLPPRLEGVAPPDSVVISEATHRLVEGFFVCEDLGLQTIKGAAAPVRAFRVLKRSEAQNRVETATALTPLVGRDREVGLLQDSWERAREGAGQVVMLVGEPGIGKSRLVHVLKQQVVEAEGAPRSVVEWRCAPFHQNSSLYPAVDFFERRLGFPREAPATERLAALEEHLAELGLAMPDTVPLFAQMLSIRYEDRYPALNLSPARAKERTLEVLLSWARQVAQAHPLLFVVEDLHWMDATSLEFLSMVVEHGVADRVLTVLTFRPEFVPAWPRKLHCTQLALNRLTKRQTAEMIRRGLEDASPAMVEQLTARTDGVPLFVEEFTRMAKESGLASGAVDAQAIPGSLNDLLMARVDRIAGTRELIQLGATLGREFTHEMLHAVTAQELGSLQRELDRLVEAGILHSKGPTGSRSYVFKHALIQDAAYQSLVRAHRQKLHGDVARVIEERFPALAEAQPEWVAHHHTEAEQLALAVRWWERAGARSLVRFANVEAIGHFHRGLEVLARCPAGVERDRTELGFQSQLAVALLMTKGWAAPELVAVHARARELCKKLGEDAAMFHTMWGTWAWRLLRAELDIARQLSDELLELARSWKDAGCIKEAHWAVGCTSLFRAELARGHEHFRKADELHDPVASAHHAKFTGQNSGATLGAHWGWLLWLYGRPDQALARGREGLERARAIGEPFTIEFAAYHLGPVYQLCRMRDETKAMADLTLAIADEQSFAIWKGLGTLCRGSALLLAGKAAEAVATLRDGLGWFNATGARLSSSHYMCQLAEALELDGKLDEALATVAQGLDYCQSTNERMGEAELWRLRGELILKKDPAGDEAERCFRQALEIAERQAAHGWRLRAATSLARWLARTGRAAEARGILAPVCDSFSEGRDTRDVKDAKELLGELA